MIIYKVRCCYRRRAGSLSPARATTPPSLFRFALLCASPRKHSTDTVLTCSQDIITGDEIISDSYDLKEIDGVAYEADCRKITVGGETFGAY